MKIQEVSKVDFRTKTINETMIEVMKFRVDYSIDDNSDYEYLMIEVDENNELVSDIDDNSMFSEKQKELLINAGLKLFKRKPRRYTLLPFLKLNQRQKNIVNKVYEMLKNSEVYPSGMTKANKFYADNSHLISCRAPSRAFPYSELNACRTKKYVARVLQYYNCKSVKTLLKHI